VTQARLLFSTNFPQELRATIASDLTRPQHLQGVRSLVQLLVKGLEAPAFERLARVSRMPIASILELSLAQEIPELNGLHGLFQDIMIDALVDADRWEEVAAFCYLIGRSDAAVKAWMNSARKTEAIRSTSRLATVRHCDVIFYLTNALAVMLLTLLHLQPAVVDRHRRRRRSLAAGSTTRALSESVLRRSRHGGRRHVAGPKTFLFRQVHIRCC
jgi:hypothetical protein